MAQTCVLCSRELLMYRNAPHPHFHVIILFWIQKPNRAQTESNRSWPETFRTQQNYRQRFWQQDERSNLHAFYISLYWTQLVLRIFQSLFLSFCTADNCSRSHFPFCCESTFEHMKHKNKDIIPEKWLQYSSDYCGHKCTQWAKNKIVPNGILKSNIHQTTLSRRNCCQVPLGKG